MRNQRFTRDNRIRSTADFQKVYRGRARASDDTIVVCGCENGLGRPRLGLSVSRKVGKATVRNRWKRLVREAFRLSRERLPTGIDLVIIPRPEVGPRLDRLRESLVRLAARIEKRLARDR